MDGVEAVLLCARGKLELALGGAELAVDAPGEVVLGGGLHVRLELGAQQLGELGGVLGLLVCSLLPVEADLGITLAVSDASHAQVHADLGALAGEVGLQLLEDVGLVLVRDLGVVLDGLVVDAVLVLGGEGELALDLLERAGRSVADRALRRRLGALVDVTADLANPLVHNGPP